MHSILSRLNAVFFIALLYLSIIAGIAGISNYIEYVNPSNKNLLANVKEIDIKHFDHKFGQIRRGIRAAKFEEAVYEYNLDVDLSEEFHWNTKEIFLWLEAEYIDKKNNVNSVSMWDNIIRSKDDSLFTINTLKQKYQFWDFQLGLRDNNVKFTLKYDVHPWVGLIERKSASYGSKEFKNPHQYNAPRKR